jgi:hypothetical protein
MRDRTFTAVAPTKDRKSRSRRRDAVPVLFFCTATASWDVLKLALRLMEQLKAKRVSGTYSCAEKA